MYPNLNVYINDLSWLSLRVWPSSNGSPSENLKLGYGAVGVAIEKIGDEMGTVMLSPFSFAVSL